MIVVDTNVIAHRLIQGDKTPLALGVCRRDAAWIVPTLWRHEFLNVLSTLTRQGMLKTGQSKRTWLAAVRQLRHVESAVNMTAALDLSVAHMISAYDAQYIVLAQAHGVRCVTEDRALRREFPETAVSMRDFCKQR